MSNPGTPEFDKYSVATEVSVVAATVPGVVGLDAGAAGHIATFGRGERIKGVVVSDEAEHTVSLRVVMNLDTSVATLDRELRAALLPIWNGRVNIEIADVHIPETAS